MFASPPHAEETTAEFPATAESVALAERWKDRLLVRRYCFPPNQVTHKDLAVRLDHDGTGYWFPLQTDAPDVAAEKAERIQQAVLSTGWESACRRFSRELIVSFEWSSNPLLWTYTTIHTLPAAPAPLLRLRRSENRRVVILERDSGIRRALKWCVSQHPGQEPHSCDSPAKFTRICADNRPALILLNRSLAEAVGIDISEGLTLVKPGVLALGYSISVDGDQMFVSTPGGASGYMLKRVAPASILEPLTASRNPDPSLDSFLDQAKAPFQELLGHRSNREVRLHPQLSPRENEVLLLLSKGYMDKEIAQELGLSIWTVHGHLKRIFERLRVRTRTEAVVRYLEK